MAKNFRQIFKFLTPAWQGRDQPDDEGGAVLYSLCAVIDGAIERARLGLEARFPSKAGESALALIGAGRGIQRGRTEAAAHYAARLVRWRYPRGHRVRGNAYALLEQVSEYFGGIECWTIDVRGNRFHRAADGTETFTAVAPFNWDGAPVAPGWGRFWLFINPGSLMTSWPAWDDPAIWGGGYGVAGTTIGQQGVTADDVNALRRLIHGRWPWKPAGVRAEWVVVTLDSNTAALPDGTWGTWSRDVAGARSTTRRAGWRFWSLTPERNNFYAGNSAVFSTTVPLIGGGTYSGNSGNFPTSLTLPSGRVYAGDAARFPNSVRLVDDGDLPQ